MARYKFALSDGLSSAVTQTSKTCQDETCLPNCRCRVVLSRTKRIQEDPDLHAKMATTGVLKHPFDVLSMPSNNILHFLLLLCFRLAPLWRRSVRDNLARSSPRATQTPEK